MTIVVSVKVRDGLILGTDSMTQISVQTPEGPRTLKAYSNARKLFQIKGRPIGVMTHGLGNIGERSIEGVVLDFSQGEGAGGASVEAVSAALYQFVRPLYDAQFAETPEGDRPVLGFVVAGYSEASPFPEEFEFRLPGDANVQAIRAAEDFGVAWRGIDVPFLRLYKGFDPQVRSRLLGIDGLGPEQVDPVLAGLETPVIYNGMPVQDAINWCSFVLDTTIVYTTFHIGLPTCGYPLQVATILADSTFNWISRPGHALEARK